MTTGLNNSDLPKSGSEVIDPKTGFMTRAWYTYFRKLPENIQSLLASVAALVVDVGSLVPLTRTINTTAPLSGGGDLTADLTLTTSMATDRLIGRDTAGTGVMEELTVGGGVEFTGSGGVQTSAFTGDVTKAAGGTALTIADEAVTYAKMQNVSAASRLLGRGDSGAGDVQEILLGSGISMTGTTLSAAGTGGDVVGPASATDNAIVRFDLTTGKLIQNSGITIADGATGTLSGTNTGDQTSIVGITGTTAEFNTALTDGDFATLAGTEVLTNKTLDSFTNYIEADALHVRVRNSSGSTIAKGSPVYISGFNLGQLLPEVSLADASVLATMPAIGLVEADIPNNTNGAVDRIGYLTGVNTIAWPEGTLLYVSETAGTLTSTAPIGAALVQPIATVLRSHAVTGVLEVNDRGVTDITAAQVAAGYQPLDTQLTSLAGLSYAANALKVVRVNAGESGFELATVSGGGGDSITFAVVQVSHGLTIGNAVTLSGTTWVKADRDANTTTAIGMVSAVADVDNFTLLMAGKMTLTTGQWDAITGDAGGLTAGEYYCLSSTAGGITKTAPTTGIKQWLLSATSTTVAAVFIGEPFDIAGLGDVLLSTGTDVTIPAGYGRYIPGTYEITSGTTLEIAATAVLEIG